jgi:hypothetical protein
MSGSSCLKVPPHVKHSSSHKRTFVWCCKAKQTSKRKVIKLGNNERKVGMANVAKRAFLLPTSILIVSKFRI